MAWLLEDPWTVIGCGAFAELLLAVALFNTRRVAVLAAMGGVLAVVLVGVAVEWFVVTEVEAVENTIYSAAKAIESDEREKVLEFIAPEAVDRLKTEIQVVRFLKVTSVKIRALEVTVHKTLSASGSLTASADFTVRGSFGSSSEASVAGRNFAVILHLKLRKDGDRWLVTDYERRQGF